MKKISNFLFKTAIFIIGLILLPVLSSQFFILFRPEIDYLILVKVSRLLFLVAYLLLPLLGNFNFLTKWPKLFIFFCLYCFLIGLSLIYGVAD